MLFNNQYSGNVHDPQPLSDCIRISLCHLHCGTSGRAVFDRVQGYESMICSSDVKWSKKFCEILLRLFTGLAK